MAPHSSTLAWKILWREEPGRLQSMGLLRDGHDWVTSLSLFTFTHWRRKCQPTRVLTWRIPGMGEPGGLPTMGLHRVGHDWSDLAAAAVCSDFLFLYDSALLNSMFLGIHLFHLGYPNFVDILVHISMNLWILMSPVSFTILFVSVFPLSLFFKLS